jgi:phage baseplate assembly protein W
MANSAKTRGISFPFRRGSFSLPAANEGVETVVDAVRSLLLIGPNEVPFAPDLGTNIHSFVFGNITEIQKVRVAQAVRNIISQKEPRMKVLAVTVSEAGGLSDGYRLMVNISYKIADQRGDINLPVN